MENSWKNYIREFIDNDNELYSNDIPNEKSLEFLEEQIPIIELPDKVIERAYYFRWWTYRKHIKTTPEGYIVTEFLPEVPWSTKYNAISCPTCFHIREGRWLKDARKILRDYIRFWLTFPEKMYCYTMWLVHAITEYCEIQDDWAFAEENFELLEEYFERRIQRSFKECGMFFSEDCEDGMEVGISGDGLRPTINSYVYADAVALAKIAKRKGLVEKEQKYLQFAIELKEKILHYLWDGEFFKTIPLENIKDVDKDRPQISDDRNVRELIGYVPWYFQIPDKEKNRVFEHLLNEEGFFTPYGLTTAEQSHPRFRYDFNHPCLWNGPIWPFATTQTLVALANAVRMDSDMEVKKEDYVMLLHQYAASFKRVLSDGKVVDWIDENMDPDNGEWLARRILEELNLQRNSGTYERGKDYNHSMFCDLVLSGLLGLHEDENGELAVTPLIPDDWKYFKVSNLYFHGEKYEVEYIKGQQIDIKKAED